MDDEESRRERDALQSRLDELLEKCRWLTEILEAVGQIHEHDGDGADSYSSSAAGSLLQHSRDRPIPVVSGDDFYPGNDDNHPSGEPEEYPMMQWEHHYDQYNQTAAAYDELTTWDVTGHLLEAAETWDEAAASGGDHDGQYLLSEPALYDDDHHDMTAGEESGDDFYPGNGNLLSGDPEEYPMQWDHHYLYNAAYDELIATVPDDTRHLLEAAETGDEAAGSGGDHGGGGQYVLSDPALYNDDNHDMTAGEATPARFSDGGGGFGGVPASAAAIATLKKQRYDGTSSGADSVCVICMRRYKTGKRLSVMPCAFKHRFHRKCIKKWLSRSHLCPLCRHALPTDDQGAVHRPQERDMAVHVS